MSEMTKMDGQLLLLIDFSKDVASLRPRFQMMRLLQTENPTAQFGAALKLARCCDYIPQKCITGSTVHPTE